MRTFSRFSCTLLLAFFVLVPSNPAMAEPPLSSPGEASQPAAAQPAPGSQKKSYREWLETYKAWDKLDEVFADGEQTPEKILEHAHNAMSSGDPHRVLEIVESTAPFEDNNATEADRLWLGAQALRALGSPEKAVAWHLQSLEYMNKSDGIRRMKTEPGLDIIWKDVFRKLFQTYAANATLSREAQGEYLGRMMVHADEAWPTDIFWTVVKKTFLDATSDVDGADSDDANNIWIKYTYSDRMQIARAVAGVAAGYPEANATLIDSVDQDCAPVWMLLLSLIDAGDRLSPPVFDAEMRSSRVSRFVDNDLSAAAKLLAESWEIKGNSEEYTDFIGNTHRLSLQQMHQLFVDGKAESLMIGTVAEKELIPLQLALAIANDDQGTAASLWEKVDTAVLQNSLKLAGMLYFNLDFSDVFRRNPDVNQTSDKLWMNLLEAAGRRPALAHQVAFWQPVVPETSRKTLIRNWPLDLDVMLAVWKYDWSNAPHRSLARRILYLYPEDQFGMLCGLYLAEESLEDKQLALSQYYLDGIDVNETNSTLTAEYYRVNADMLILKEDMDGAYQSYQQLIGTGAPIDDETRLKIAFLLQQRGELAAGREHLLKLWERRDEFKTSMQAEILFYLAEGDQAMGQSDQALDYYLQLAWQYPQESMWALTAMYRAATIYESREQYEPAARLLTTVVKNAQTGKQREAAQARLDHIESRQAKSTDHGVGSVPYPF